jgi:hypothetical protein
MSDTSIYVLILSYVLVFTLDHFTETSHGNEYQFHKESIQVKYSTDITKCASPDATGYYQCVTKAEVIRNTSMIELYSKYKECSTSKVNCNKIVVIS